MPASSQIETHVSSSAHRDATLPFTLLCCVPLAAATLWTTFDQPFTFHDFLGYWAAARLFLTHQNPYSAQNLIALQHSQGWPWPRPLIMLCPPWALPVIASLGCFSLSVARIVWLVLSILLSAFSAVGLWRYFGGERSSLWIPAAVFLTFTPLGTALHMGQLTPLILACLTAFLLLVQSERWFLAGLTLLGFGLKPHLLWLVTAAILLWAIRLRRFQLLAGAATAFIAATAAALVIDPPSMQYLHSAYGAAVDTSCGFGGALRLLFGARHAWLQYLPCLFGAAWFIAYFGRHRAKWSWPEHLPLLLIVSVASSPYCWFHDFILVLPAFIALAVHRAYRSVAVLVSWLVVQFLILLPFAKAEASALSALWIVFYLFARSELVPSRIDDAPAPASAAH